MIRPDRFSFCRLFHDADFVAGQAVEFVDEQVDLAVGGINLAFAQVRRRGFFFPCLTRFLNSCIVKPASSSGRWRV
jgi:hypothetical protein